MRGSLYQFATDLRLYYRNRMALLYGYLFPTIFLVAFWVLYRHELVPLVNHMGELLTVTALGGACFGLPTAMVSERERGVWRRYRIAPVSTLQVVLGTLASRYVILITAALLQIVLAVWIGMPLPDHLFDLWLAFTFVSFAFLGLGLVIAMLADNVPAVQALGQSIFLPMLIIGGVAVRIESLPAWAQHVSAFFPGRYSVEAMQVCVNGPGLGAARFSLLALLLVGTAGCLAAAKLFRWDAQERFVTRSGKAWLGVALAAWVAVGLLAEAAGRISPQPLARSEHASIVSRMDSRGDVEVPRDSAQTARVPRDTVVDTPEAPSGGVVDPGETGAMRGRSENAEGERAQTPGEVANSDAGEPEDTAAVTNAEPQVEDTSDGVDAVHPPADPAVWQLATLHHVERDINFEALPPDDGLVAPIAGANDAVYSDVQNIMDCISDQLQNWAPAQDTDLVQRARNVLYIAAVPDMFQMGDVEGFIPHVIFDFLRSSYPESLLLKVLYWIVMHPEEGDITASSVLPYDCLGVGGPDDVDTLRERTSLYAAKLLGRLTGDISTG